MSPQVLDHFIDRLPRRPYCTDDLSCGIQPRPLKSALYKAYIQPNRPHTFTYVVFDIDRQDAFFSWYDADLPPPTLIIRTPENGHAHLAYEMAAPVYAGADNKRPIRYLQAIKTAYTVRLSIK